jgi:hypothetical protein
MFGTSTPLFLTVLLGGLILSALGTAQTIYYQNEPFQVKGAIRDFCIGAIMVTFLYQMVPDSVVSVGTFLSGFKMPEMPKMSGVAMPASAMMVGSETDFDLQTGVPRF